MGAALGALGSCAAFSSCASCASSLAPVVGPPSLIFLLRLTEFRENTVKINSLSILLSYVYEGINTNSCYGSVELNFK